MQSVISFVRDNATGSSVGVCVNVYSCMIVLPSVSFSSSFDTVTLAAYYLAIRIQLIIFGVQRARPTEGPTNVALPTNVPNPEPLAAAPHGIEKIFPLPKDRAVETKAHSGCQESVRERELTRLRLATERTTTRDTAPSTPPAPSILNLTGCWRCDLLVRVSKEHRFTSCSKNRRRNALAIGDTFAAARTGRPVPRGGMSTRTTSFSHKDLMNTSPHAVVLSPGRHALVLSAGPHELEA